MINKERLEIANNVLPLFAQDVRLLVQSTGHIAVEWQRYGRKHDGKKTIRRWITRGQNFWPVWSHKFPHGGTRTIALSQLVRWCQGKPVLPLSTWEYWMGDQVCLGHNAEYRGCAVAILREAGYPEKARCIFCDKVLRSFDWYHIDGKSGPGCYYGEGCKSVPLEQQENER